MRAFFSAPAPGAAVAPEAETVVIRGAVTGPVVDAALAVGFGHDPASFDPIPLASPLPDRDGELARWDVSAREDGPYLLRLDVRGADGSRAVEFLPRIARAQRAHAPLLAGCTRARAGDLGRARGLAIGARARAKRSSVSSCSRATGRRARSGAS